MENELNGQTSATDPAADARRARVEELQRRRAAGTVRGHAEPASSLLQGPPVEPDRSARTPRAGAAQGSKVAAAGFGLAAMFALVGAMGLAARTSASTPSAPVETTPSAQVVVVVHPADGTAGSTVAAGSPGLVAAAPAQPIVLRAQPTVRQVPASQAPAGQTNGSR